MKKKKVQSPFDSTMEDRSFEIKKAEFVALMTKSILENPQSSWDKLIEKFVLSSPIDEYETRMLFKIITDEQMQKLGIESTKRETTTNIHKLDLLYTEKNKEKIYIINTENICRILRNHTEFAYRFRFDIFTNKYEFLQLTAQWKTLEDSDVIGIQTKISSLLPPFSRVSKQMVYDAVIKVSKENQIDSAGDFIRSLVWDGVPRLDTWLSSVYGVEDTEYHKKVGSNWLKGMIKRLMYPGCKFDFVIVLEGEQGAKKSTSLSILGGSWHTETTMSTDSKDFFMQFAGKSIIEFSEGETLSRTEVKRMKAIITMQYDRYRMPYERSTLDYPRRCVFAMTTNQTEYLKDETGNRRWLPVKVVYPQANIDWLKENREQLFAEAYYRVSVLNETVWEFPQEDMLREQSARMVHDPNEDLVADWYANICPIAVREAGITTQQIYSEVLHKFTPSRPMSRMDEMSIGQIFRSMGLERRRVQVGGVRIYKYYPPQMSTPSELQEQMEKEKYNIAF